MKNKFWTTVALVASAVSFDDGCSRPQVRQRIRTIVVRESPGAICHTLPVEKDGRAHYFKPDPEKKVCLAFALGKTPEIGNDEPLIFTLVPKPGPSGEGVPQGCFVIYKRHASFLQTDYFFPCKGQTSVKAKVAQMHQLFNRK